jgi:hypothetical protein
MARAGGFGRVVVLLGAGASKDAGLYLSAELTEKLFEDIEAEKETELQRALGLILGSMAFRRGREGKRMNEPVDIEEVLGIAQHLSLRNDHPLAWFVASWHSALEAIAPDGDGIIFERLIRRSHQVLHSYLRTPDEDTAVKYLAGICRLTQLDQADAPPPEVFTLNYDLCVEKALGYERIPFTTGFTEGLWTKAEFEKPDRLRLYKLHGSFGWVRHPETGSLYERNEALRRDDIDVLSGDTDDDLIFAVENKFSPRQPYLWMAHRFGEALAAADYIVTIGYGYRDSYINEIIGGAMAASPSKSLVVVGPSMLPVQLEAAMPRTFYPGRTSFVPDPAKKALLENDTIHKELIRLERTKPEASPFDMPT